MYSGVAISSPAHPAILLLFGMLFSQTAFHFIGMPWSRGITIVFFLTVSAWVIVLAWRQRLRLLKLNAIDLLFLVFITILLVSLGIGGEVTASVMKYAPFIFFMTFIPYVCGRLMHHLDIISLQRVLLILAVSMLPLMLVKDGLHNHR